MRDQRGQLGFALKRGNAVELGLERRDALAVYRRSIHARGVLVADLLFVDGAGACRIGFFLENLLEMEPVELVELGKAAVRGLISGQRIALEPALA